MSRAGARKSSFERSDSGSRGEAAAGFWTIPVVQSCVRLHLPKEGLEISSPFLCRRFRTSRQDHVIGLLVIVIVIIVIVIVIVIVIIIV